MKAALDAAMRGARLSSQGREEVAVVTTAGDPELARILARLSEASAPSDVTSRERLVKETYLAQLTGMEQLFQLGTSLESRISTWRPELPIVELTSHLTVAVTLNSYSSEQCVSMSLRRALPLLGTEQPQQTQRSLLLLLETALYHYKVYDLNVELAALKDVFEAATNLPFSLLSRAGSRLIRGSKDGTQRLAFPQFIKFLFSPARIAGASQEEMRSAIAELVAERPVKEWERLLSTLYFDQASSTSALSKATETFLKLCFSADNPPLLLVFIPAGEQTWLVRTADLARPAYRETDLYDRIKENGLIAPEMPGAGDDPFAPEFFDRVANAHSNASTWLQTHRKNVLQFPQRQR